MQQSGRITIECSRPWVSSSATETKLGYSGVWWYYIPNTSGAETGTSLSIVRWDLASKNKVREREKERGGKEKKEGRKECTYTDNQTKLHWQAKYQQLTKVKVTKDKYSNSLYQTWNFSELQDYFKNKFRFFFFLNKIYVTIPQTL